jgi:hypothetical protein
MMSRDELARMIPVSPPIVKRNTNPKAQSRGVSNENCDPWSVANQLKILIPVGTAMIIVAAEK